MIIDLSEEIVTILRLINNYDHLGRLIAENIDKTFYGVGTESSKIVYLYDESGIIGMQYTNSTTATTNTYYFLRNLQGDVIAIYDTTGNKVVEYSYDAYGNCTINSSTTNYPLAHANPIRYRGYYYDEATKLYYLNARYYNPQWRRFISPDDTAYLDPETPNGLNLYCYCNNDPVNYCDPSGHLAFWIITALIGAAAGLTYGAYTDYKDDNSINGSIGWQTYLGYGLVGGAIGTGIGFTIGYFSGSAISSYVGGVLSSMGGSSALAIAGGGTASVANAGVLEAMLAVGLGIAFFSKPNSGRIRFSDGTGIDPLTGKPVTNPDRAYKIYRSLTDPIKKANWKKWMKGKGWRTNHLK